ncbi:MAG: DNA polymerase III subunit epsilon [Hyphomicrobiaceae bacterium]
MREIVLDTETTGLEHRNGDRLIELGCIELVNRIPSGREYHAFIHPEDREVHPDAERIHGISSAFLADKPKFAEVVDDFLAFIGEAPLVIHNASFDTAFINMELKRIGRPPLSGERVIDTLMLARRKHPAGPNTLDALCKRYGIDNSIRTKHGAIMDSLLLAEVYVELIGERQAVLGLSRAAVEAAGTEAGQRVRAAQQRPAPLPSRLTTEDVARHRAFIDSLGSGALWLRHLPLAAEQLPEAS